MSDCNSLSGYYTHTINYLQRNKLNRGIILIKILKKSLNKPILYLNIGRTITVVRLIAMGEGGAGFEKFNIESSHKLSTKRQSHKTKLKTK